MCECEKSELILKLDKKIISQIEIMANEMGIEFDKLTEWILIHSIMECKIYGKIV